MSVAGDWIASASGLDPDVGPQDPRQDVHRRHLRNWNALFIATEQTRLDPANPLSVDHDAGREEKVPCSPAAGHERFGFWGGHW